MQSIRRLIRRMRIQAELRPVRMKRSIKTMIRKHWNGSVTEVRYRSFVLHPTKGWQAL